MDLWIRTQDKQSVERENNVLKLNRQSLQSQLDIANKKLDRVKEYVTEKLIYIDNCDDQDTILSIIGGE